MPSKPIILQGSKTSLNDLFKTSLRYYKQETVNDLIKSAELARKLRVLALQDSIKNARTNNS